MTRPLRWLLPPLIALATAGIIALLMVTAPDTPEGEVEERVWPVQMVTAERGAHAPVLRLQGFVESPRSSTLTAAVEGDVAAMPVREGARVEAGDTLLRLDDRELQLQLAQQVADVRELDAQRRIEAARTASERDALELERELLGLLSRERERLESLSRDQLAALTDRDRAQQDEARQKLAVRQRRESVETAEARMDQVEARLERARAVRDRTRLDLERTEVTAPFAGRIAERLVAEGDRVRPGEPLIALYDHRALELRTLVPAGSLGRLRAAQALDEPIIGEAAIDGDRVPARLAGFGGRAERGQGGVEALFRLGTDGDAPVLGRFGTLTLELPPQPGTFVLPYEALYDTDRVYRVRDERMEAVPVERLGHARREDGELGVLVRAEGLATGERLVATQLPQAMDGLRVRDSRDGAE